MRSQQEVAWGGDLQRHLTTKCHRDKPHVLWSMVDIVCLIHPVIPTHISSPPWRISTLYLLPKILWVSNIMCHTAWVFFFHFFWKTLSPTPHCFFVFVCLSTWILDMQEGERACSYHSLMYIPVSVQLVARYFKGRAGRPCYAVLCYAMLCYATLCSMWWPVLQMQR